MSVIQTWFFDGGPLLPAILIVAAIALALLVERVSYIVVRSKIHARPFMERVITLARANKVDEALKVCAEHQSALPDLGLVILRSKTRDEADLLNVVEAATLAVVPALTRRIAWIRTLAGVLVMLGISGAIASYQIEVDRGLSGALATAVALRPLGAAILLSVPLIVGHAVLAAEAEKLIGQMEEFSARLINALIDRPDVRLGHRD